jgi:hypothetical protein
MIDELGDDQEVIDAAIGLVSAETNFNPFAVDVPFVCADPALPATEVLRGITPLVDPAVDGADVANAASEESVATPFDATGLSQAEVLLAQGFSSFTAVDANGENIVLAGQDGGAADEVADEDAAGDDVVDEENDVVEEEENVVDDEEEVVEEDDAEEDAHPIQCGGNNVGNGNAGNGNNQQHDNNQNDNNQNDNSQNDDNQNDDNQNDDNQNDNNQNDNDQNDNNQDNQQDDNQQDDEEAVDDGANNGGGALDFGLCQPTMALIGGLNGRPADELTFIPQDPLIAEGQQEALNPNIITNRICDQLGNVCEADEAAIAACEDAQAEIEALGTRDQSTADTWNALLGFAGQDTTVEVV